MVSERIMSTRGFITMAVLAVALVGASLPGTAQTDSVGAQNPAVTHNTWTNGTGIPTPVWGAASGVLKDNIYVVGGSTTGAGDSTSAVQVYDPAINSWSTGVSLPTPLMGPVGAVVKNVLYIFGGSSNINCSPADSG